jgi:small subunit ribosomal protein S21
MLAGPILWARMDDHLARAPLGATSKYGGSIWPPFDPIGVTHLQVFVRDNNVDQALKVLKKKMQREGVFREMKLRSRYEKPSERKTREKAEAIRRARKVARKKLQREGLLPMKPRIVRGAPPRGGPARHP